MGGRNMEELGYKVAGKEAPENTGGDWKISPEYWGMIEDRMETERQRVGRLTFERFVAQIQSGRNGEKLKYDKVSRPRTRAHP
jgi:DNA polymerase zeta